MNLVPISGRIMSQSFSTTSCLSILPSSHCRPWPRVFVHPVLAHDWVFPKSFFSRSGLVLRHQPFRSAVLTVLSALCVARFERYQPSRGYQKPGRPAKKWEDDTHSYLQPTRAALTTTTTTTHCSSSLKESKVDPQQQSNNNQQTSKTANIAPATLFIVSEPHSLFKHRYRPTSFQVARGLSRLSRRIISALSGVFRQTGKRPRPTHSGPQELHRQLARTFVVAAPGFALAQHSLSATMRTAIHNQRLRLAGYRGPRHGWCSGSVHLQVPCSIVSQPSSLLPSCTSSA